MPLSHRLNGDHENGVKYLNLNERAKPRRHEPTAATTCPHTTLIQIFTSGGWPSINHKIIESNNTAVVQITLSYNSNTILNKRIHIYIPRRINSQPLNLQNQKRVE